MGRTEYKTKQKDALMRYIRSRSGTHLTASEIHEYLREEGYSIGLTTVYRHLDRLVSEGVVQKYTVSDTMPACYAYSGSEEKTDPDAVCLHCICIGCGRLVHIHCHEMNAVTEHIAESHSFYLIPQRTVFYGICEQCRE